jgi:branched-chain amino acid transport system substrate-binding protein
MRVSYLITCWFSLVCFLACFVGCPASTPKQPSNDTKKSPGNDKSVANGETIRIVSSLPRTGSARGQTDTIVNGIKMALDEIQYKVGDFTIEYSDLDDATAAQGKWDPVQEGNNAKQAASDPDCMVYIGTYNSGAAKISLPLLNEAGLLMISPANTAIGLTKSGGEPGEPERYYPNKKRHYCRVVPADDIQGPLGAEWAKEMGLKSVYIIDDTEVYGQGLANAFEEHCETIGLKVLGHESIDATSLEFKTLMTKIKAKNPDLIYFGGTTQTKGGQLAKDIISVGMTAKLMVPDGCFEETFIESAGADNLNGRCFITFGGLPPEELKGDGAEFVKKYKAKYNADPEGYAIYGYEAAKVAIHAIEKAGKKDRAAILESAFAIRDFKGALGTWSFDANGDTSLTTMSGNTVENGKFKFVKVLGGEK